MQDFVFVGDVVQALWQAVLRQANGIYNIASGKPVTMLSLAESILSILPESRSEIVFSDQPDAQAFYRGVFSIEKAKRDLAYEPKTLLRDGLLACLTSLC